LIERFLDFIHDETSLEWCIGYEKALPLNGRAYLKSDIILK
jgi:hypothetical protein